MTDQALAEYSNWLIYSAMLVYVGALSAYVLDLAQVGEAVSAARRARRERAEATAASGGVLATETVSASRTIASRGGATAVAEREPSTSARRGGVGRGDATDGVPVRRKAAGIAVSLTWLALALHVAGVVARGLSAHRAPWGNMYEFAISGSSVVVLVLVLTLLRRDVRYLGAFVIGPVLGTLLVAVVSLYTASAPLVPALQSYWLVIHVSVAFISSALFTLAFSANILQLVQGRREGVRAVGEEPRGARFMDAVPGARELDQLAYRLIAISFPMWTFTLVAGAIWAEVSWGRYWNWDPKEVWTFVIFVVYAAYLHARATGGWNGRRATWLALAGYACVLVNFGVVNVFFPGNHSYAGIG